MKIINFLKSVIKKPANQHESKYYEDLFIENNYWNTPQPNEEELLRWGIIENFLHFLQKEEGFSSNSNILDLGCGRGWLTNLLSNFGTVRGIEPVYAVAQYAKSLFPGLDIIPGDSKILLREEKFKKYDLIVSSEVIEHIENDAKKDFVKDIKSLLEVSGYVIITTPRKEAEMEWKQYLNPNQPIEEWMTEQTVEELFRQAGFQPLQQKRFSIKPTPLAPLVEIYQLWLFKKK